jgi:uncharacterized RDD family membrane protein YckC
MQTEEQVPDLLTTFDNHVVRADTGKRFVNYIIDFMVFYLLVFGVAIVIVLLSPDTLDGIAEDDSFDLGGQLLILVLYGLYMGIVEAVFKGKSLGKLITRTRAVNLDGSRITTSTAFTRGLCRAVPFCAFSALGSPCNPWQDKWTDTMVMDERQSDTGL